MTCSNTSFLASNTRSTAYFTVWITCPPIMKSPKLSWASLLRYSPNKLNTIGEKQHPCLTSLPLFTLLVSAWSSFSLILWSMWNWPINILLRQLVPVTFRICINLVQFTCSNTFCQSTKHAHNSSTLSKVHSDNILSIPVVSLGPFPSLNPNWSSSSTFSIFSSILLLSIHATILALCATRLLHFVVYGFFFKATDATLVQSLGPSTVSYIADQLCHYSQTIFCQQFKYIPRTSSFPAAVVSLISLIAFSTLLHKTQGPFSSGSTSPSGSTFRISGWLGDHRAL